MRCAVFTTYQIGYWFCTLSAGGVGYIKTTNGGATWGSPVTISGNTNVQIAGDAWFDKWTPSD